MGTPRAPLEILERARGAGDPEPAEVGALTRYWVEGIATDAQMAAWCASPAAAAAGVGVARAIGRELVASGRRLDPAALGPTADAQTTGAVGDAAGILAIPVAVAAGARVLHVAADGAGHIGGARTALGAIPGLDVALDPRAALRAARDAGAVVTGGPAGPAPAAARLEILLGEIGGSASPAVSAAILAARALAAGAAGAVVRASWGGGGTFATRESAGRCAAMARDVISSAGATARAGVLAAQGPLGPAVGNALEIAAVGAVLRGDGHDDLAEGACAIAGGMLEAAGLEDEGAGVAAAQRTLADGRALAAAERWIAGQGGDPAVWTDASRLAQAPLELPVSARADGTIAAIDAGVLGRVARMLGAGRLHASQGVDYAAGIRLAAWTGELVAVGDPVAYVHARDRGLGEDAVAAVAAAVRVEGRSAPAPREAVEWLEAARA